MWAGSIEDVMLEGLPKKRTMVMLKHMLGAAIPGMNTMTLRRPTAHGARR